MGQFVDRFRGEMVPLGNRFSYFCAAVALSEDDLRDFLEEPIAALPPRVQELLPRIQIVLVPYLEIAGTGARARANGGAREIVVVLDKPQETKTTPAGSLVSAGEAVLAFAIKDAEVADHHYRLYRAIAELAAAKRTEEDQQAYAALLREELNAGTHGEVDEDSWRAKQALLRRAQGRHETKVFHDYERASYIDTLTLYLHGICCDIDVETGPRQLPSRYLRKRLKLLQAQYPQPKGYAVFPEELTEPSS